MKISAVRCVNDFNRKYDRMSGRNTGEVRLEHKMALLNEALLDYFENKVQLAEVNSEVRDILRPVEYKNVELEKIEQDSTLKYDVFELKDEFYRVIRRSAIINKEGCGDKEVEPLIFQTDDLNSARKSPYWKSSYEWENLLADNAHNGLFLWHEGEFKVKHVFVDYFKQPEQLKAAKLHPDGKYIDSDGNTVTSNNHLELGGNSHNEIVDLAVYYHMAAIGDIRDVKTNIQKILNTEKLTKN